MGERVLSEVGYIKPALITEISEKLDQIRGNPDYFDQRQKLVRDNLRAIGDVYSFWIENPELRRALNRTNPNSAKEVRKMARQGIRNITDAWYYLQQIGQGKDFVNLLTPQIVQGTNGIVNGVRARDGVYRKIVDDSSKKQTAGDVTLNTPDYTVPSPPNIPGMVDRIIGKSVRSYDEKPLESAIYTHLSLALTQPFIEGNKRTARLIQDRMLADKAMPPVMIHAGEGKFYMDLLSRVAPSWKRGDLEGQEIFYNYMASKVNVGLDYILGDFDDFSGEILS